MANSTDVPIIWRQKSAAPDIWLKTDEGPKTKVERHPLLLSSNEVNIYGLIWTWPSWRERFMFFAGWGGQLAMTAASSVVISRTVRDRFYLSGNLASFISAYAAVSISSAMFMFLNDSLVVSPLFASHTHPDTICMTCIQTQQTLANIIMGVGFPALLLIPESLSLAWRDPKYPTQLPKFGQFKQTAKFISEKYRGQVVRSMGRLSLAHIVVTALGTYLQTKAAFRVTLAVDDDPSILSEYLHEREEGLLEGFGRFYRGLWRIPERKRID